MQHCNYLEPQRGELIINNSQMFSMAIVIIPSIFPTCYKIRLIRVSGALRIPALPMPMRLLLLRFPIVQNAAAFC